LVVRHGGIVRTASIDVRDRAVNDQLHCVEGRLEALKICVKARDVDGRSARIGAELLAALCQEEKGLGRVGVAAVVP
jgi:hypothetical protein